jgi:hypothetical protein
MPVSAGEEMLDKLQHFSPAALVPNILSAIVSASAISLVRKPAFKNWSTALITASDSSFIPKEISSNKAAERIEASD